MKIIIAGGGKVGAALIRQLSSEGHDLTLIDTNTAVLERTMTAYDVMAVQGNCATMATLHQAGVEDADLLIAVTNADEVNLLCCMKSTIEAGSMDPNTGLKYTWHRSVRLYSCMISYALSRSSRLPETNFTVSSLSRSSKFSMRIALSQPLDGSL